MNRVAIALLSTLSCLCTLQLQTASAAEAQLPPSITVSGTGRVYARPDMAQVNLGVVSQTSSATAALAQNNSAMTALIALLKTSGIDEKDVLTSNFNVSPAYAEYTGSSSIPRPPKVVAYRVENTVTAKVRKIASLGGLLDAVVKAGANNINGVSLTIAEEEPLYDKARTSAIVDAKRKAQIYANAAGIKIGRVLYIDESTSHSPVPYFKYASTRAQSVESTPIAAGEQELESTVQVVYAIEP